MPALQSVVLTDRTPVTPANLTFNPRNSVDGVGEVVANAGTPVGEKRLTVSMKQTGKRFKGEVRLTLPVVVTEVINGVSAPKVVRTSYVNLSASFDETSTEQERTDAIGLMASALGTGKVLINDALVKVEGVY
jgi:hypothetical protein